MKDKEILFSQLRELQLWLVISLRSQGVWKWWVNLTRPLLFTREEERVTGVELEKAPHLKPLLHFLADLGKSKISKLWQRVPLLKIEPETVPCEKLVRPFRERSALHTSFPKKIAYYKISRQQSVSYAASCSSEAVRLYVRDPPTISTSLLPCFVLHSFRAKCSKWPHSRSFQIPESTQRSSRLFVLFNLGFILVSVIQI
jgi:hypothetical protein